MTRWTADDIPDQSGRTVIVTGATGGLGLVTARQLARAGAHVVLAVRDTARGTAAAAAITGSTEVRALDVSDLSSIQGFVDGWSGSVDILVNNAGIMEVPLARTADGIESQMATNYVGPFVLTTLLMPQITDRVVSVTSQLHRMGKVHLDDLQGSTRPYKAGEAYNDSKLALNLFSAELQRRLTAAGSPVRSVLAHPGIASTTLASHAPSGRVTGALKFLFNDPETGALSTLFAATEDIPGNSYVGPRGLFSMKGHPTVRTPSAASLDPETGRRLWDRTVELTGTGSDLPAAA